MSIENIIKLNYIASQMQDKKQHPIRTTIKTQPKSKTQKITKKLKRNRKYYLKRCSTLLSINIETGIIEISQTSDFILTEILQGGHQPQNQQLGKEIKKYIYLDDVQQRSQCLDEGLQLVSRSIVLKMQSNQKLSKQVTPKMYESEQVGQMFQIKDEEFEDQLAKLKNIIEQQHRQLILPEI